MQTNMQNQFQYIIRKRRGVSFFFRHYSLSRASQLKYPEEIPRRDIDES